MKKVVLKETQEVSIDQITNDSIVGIEWNDGVKAYISKNAKGFISIGIYDGNVDFNYFKGSKKEYAVNEIKSYSAKVWLFDTEEEIIEWLKS